MRQGQRQIAKGTSAIQSKSTATLATVSRNAGECVSLSCFVADNIAGAGFGADVTDGVFVWLERTAQPEQFLVKGENRHKQETLTIEWCVIGVVPA